ncbi:MAG: pyridoxal-phosphate dependent enzyme [Bacteroidota bacterium]
MEQNKPMHLLPENIINLSAANIERLHLPVLDKHQIILDVLRLDKIDHIISGNKWFKLKYYLEGALQNNRRSVLTFGGAWSNHIVATASAAKKAGLASVGVIRGERPLAPSHTLLKAISLGMKLVYVSRETYNQKKDPAFIEQLLQEYDQPCIIPEGGEGETGIKGAAEICGLADIENYTHLVCAVGTGTLLAGLAMGSLLHHHIKIIGVPVLKGFDNWMPPGRIAGPQQRIYIEPGYHFGGYAKKNDVLVDFMNQLYQQTNIPTDFVYTGKLFFSINDLIKKDYFPKQSRLLAIHSGGLQGNDSLAPGTLVF